MDLNLNNGRRKFEQYVQNKIDLENQIRLHQDIYYQQLVRERRKKKIVKRIIIAIISLVLGVVGGYLIYRFVCPILLGLVALMFLGTASGASKNRRR